MNEIPSNFQQANRGQFHEDKELKENSTLKKMFFTLNEFFSKRKYPLPYYHGHYFHDTPTTMSCWHISVEVLK